MLEHDGGREPVAHLNRAEYAHGVASAIQRVDLWLEDVEEVPAERVDVGVAEREAGVLGVVLDRRAERRLVHRLGVGGEAEFGDV